MTNELAVSLEATRAVPGAPVLGMVTVRGGGDARRLTVALRYRERSDYAPEIHAVTAHEVSEELPLRSGELIAGSTRPFSLRLPDDAPPNYRSNHGELWWELEARLAGSGHDATASARVEF